MIKHLHDKPTPAKPRSKAMSAYERRHRIFNIIAVVGVSLFTVGVFFSVFYILSHIPEAIGEIAGRIFNAFQHTRAPSQ